MKTNRQLFWFVTVFFALLLAACGTPATSTPTGVPPTEFPSETPTMVDVMVTETPTETETPVPTATIETPTPTPTGPAGVVPVQLVCWFCVQQVPHVIVTLPGTATFEVLASSAGVECKTVETVDDKQIVLCQGPKQSGNVSFDLMVCSNGNCSDRHIVTVDCAATAMPSATSIFTPTVTSTLVGTTTPGAVTQTPTTAAGAATFTLTPALSVTSSPTPVSLTLTPIVIPLTPTPC